MKKNFERFKSLLLARTEVGDTISSIGAIDLVMSYIESGGGGRYFSTAFMPSRHQAGYIMGKIKQFEKIETSGSALWRRIE